MNAQIAPARDCRHPSATKSKPRNDTHWKILGVLGDQTLTTNQITNLIGHESWIGVASALRAMHAHGEVAKLKSRDGQGIQSAKWRRK
ncbi:MAG: hypothetical protein KGH75_10000 [Rhodospirillales bacterium]|nr:hypothetical protein [Rhodospirillales bacterium]